MTVTENDIISNASGIADLVNGTPTDVTINDLDVITALGTNNYLHITKDGVDKKIDIETAITDSNVKIPTSGAVVDYLSSQGTLLGKPIGSYYWQPSEDDGTFTSANEPGTLFGGTWSRLWNGGDGEFPKAEGGTGGQTRTSGLQPDQFQGHWHKTGNVGSIDLTGGGSNELPRSLQSTTANDIIIDPVTDGTNGTPRTGTVTEPTNREFKLWKRTA